MKKKINKEYVKGQIKARRDIFKLLRTWKLEGIIDFIKEAEKNDKDM